jgi:hypothetical protein
VGSGPIDTGRETGGDSVVKWLIVALMALFFGPTKFLPVLTAAVILAVALGFWPAGSAAMGAPHA